MIFIDTYKDIKKYKPMGLRGKARSIALSSLSLIDRAFGNSDLLKKPRVQILNFHHVFKDEKSKFEKLIKKLSIDHTFISYSEAVNKISGGEIDKPYITFTSDDGIKNNILAGNIMNNYGIKGCFFINPAIINETKVDIIENHCRTRIHFPAVEFLTWDEINNLQSIGHEIGSHTMEHINIAITSEEKIVEDMRKTIEIITKYCGYVKHFAFPYGTFNHFNDTGRKAVFESGFISCASAVRGCHIPHNKLILKDELCIRRDHVVFDWDINHIIYFLANNSKKASFNNNLFPYKHL